MALAVILERAVRTGVGAEHMCHSRIKEGGR